MRRSILAADLLLLSLGLTIIHTPPAAAQITLDSAAFQTGASASTPACTDLGNGGPGISMATADCALPFGYTAAASATANIATNPNGATFALAAQAGATASGDPPAMNSNGNASCNLAGNWTATAAVHYSVSYSGDAFLNINGTAGSLLPVSGTVGPGEQLSVSASTNAFAQAQTTGPLTAADSSSGEGEIVFAAVGDPDLIMGTLLGDGSPIAGLRVEALDGGSPILVTHTASDGSYLLPDVPMPIVLRLSDPAGNFVTELSPVVAPPATYDADLAPNVAVPGLVGPGLVLLATGLALTGARRGRQERRARQWREGQHASPTSDQASPRNRFGS